MENLTPDFSEICDQYKSALIVLLSSPQHQLPQLQQLGIIISNDPVLRAGRQYLRSTSLDGSTFSFPVQNAVLPFPIIAWSNILNDKEVLCAVNLNDIQAVEYVTIDNDLHLEGSKMCRFYGPEDCPRELNVENRNGKAIRLTIPPLTFVVYE